MFQLSSYTTSIILIYSVENPEINASKVQENHTKIEIIEKIEGNYMCDVAVAIYTAPQHAGTRVKDAQKSWTTRICPYGTIPSTLNFNYSFIQQYYYNI